MTEKELEGHILWNRWSFSSGVSNLILSEGHIPKKKMIRGPKFITKKTLRAAVYRKSPQNKLNKTNKIKLSKIWSKFILLSAFKMFAGRVFETPDLVFPTPPSSRENIHSHFSSEKLPSHRSNLVWGWRPISQGRLNGTFRFAPLKFEKWWKKISPLFTKRPSTQNNAKKNCMLNYKWK